MRKSSILKRVQIKIDIITLEIIEKMIRSYSIPSDVAERKFRQSITYKILSDPSSDFYLKSSDEIFDILKHEFFMDQYLNSQMKFASNHLEESKNQMVQEITKMFSILNEVPIEESFYSFIHSSYYHSFTQKDILDYLKFPSKTYQTLKKEINLHHRKNKKFCSSTEK